MTRGMVHRPLLASLVVLAACDKSGLDVVEPEVGKPGVKVELPAVPNFELPASGPDSHSVKELRVKGRKLLDSEVTVKGVITWAYDCATSIRKEGESDKDVQKRIDDDPTLCERPRFIIGDAADTPVEKSMWVVDLPRYYNKLELERIKKQDRTFANHPDLCEPKEDPKKDFCPPYKVGDVVTITADLKLSSPKSWRNSDGLLVYKKMKNETQNWPPDGWVAPVAPPPGPAGSPPPAPTGGPTKPSPEDLVKKKPS